ATLVSAQIVRPLLISGTKGDQTMLNRATQRITNFLLQRRQPQLRLSLSLNDQEEAEPAHCQVRLWRWSPVSKPRTIDPQHPSKMSSLQSLNAHSRAVHSELAKLGLTGSSRRSVKRSAVDRVSLPPSASKRSSTVGQVRVTVFGRALRPRRPA